MFNRQWFAPGSQQGLYTCAALIEDCLRRRDFKAAAGALEASPLKSSYVERQRMRIRKIANAANLDSSSRIIHIYFSGFWPDMNPFSCQLLDFLRVALCESKIIVTQSPNIADIIFESCYGKLLDPQEAPDATWVLFLGENVRPSFTRYDLSISSDDFSYTGKNIYLPLWLFEVDWFNCKYADRSPYSVSNFCQPVTWNYGKRHNRVLFVGNNHEPVRVSLMEELQAQGIPIDIFGSHTRPIDNKIELAKKYKVMIGMENSSFPGYITEKIVHPYLAGCHSIRFGDLASFGSSSLLNRIYQHSGESENNSVNVATGVRNIFKIEESLVFAPLFERKQLYDKFFKVVGKLRSALSYYLP